MKAALTVSALALSVGVAHADGLAPPITPTVIPAAPVAAPTWSGFYAGGYLGMSNGNMFDIGGPYVLNNNANHFSGLVGYRYDMGDYVVGGEFSTSASVNMFQAAFPTWAFNRVSDARVTVGRDLGRSLVYVAAGYTNTGFSVGPTNYIYDGWNAGIGIDTMVTDNMFVGAEYVWRSVSRTDLRAWTADFGTIQLRAGFRF